MFRRAAMSEAESLPPRLKKADQTLASAAGASTVPGRLGAPSARIGSSLSLIRAIWATSRTVVRPSVELENPNTLRNLPELAAAKTLIETFKKAINALTVRDRGDSEIHDTIKLRQTRLFVVRDQGYLIPKKSGFNRVIGDSQLELQFANFLEDCPDVVSYAKNYFAVHFKLDYVNADGNISNYYPDFLVWSSPGFVDT